MGLRKSRVFITLFCIVFIACIVYSLISKNNNQNNRDLIETDSQVVYEENIRMGVAEFDTINPIMTKNKSMMNINQLIYEPLFHITSDYRAEANLAKEIAKVEKTVYVLKIDSSVKWSDGTSLSARDIKYTIDLIKSRENIYSSNAKNIREVEIVDDDTLRVILRAG